MSFKETTHNTEVAISLYEEARRLLWRLQAAHADTSRSPRYRMRAAALIRRASQRRAARYEVLRRMCA